MVVAEEELACRKLPAITHHVEKQGVKFGSDDKITRKTCTEMVDIIADLLLQTLHDISAKGKYVSLTGDGSETWSWFYGKVLLKGYQIFLPGTFFLACRSLKAHGRPTGDGTKVVMLHAS